MTDFPAPGLPLIHSSPAWLVTFSFFSHWTYIGCCEIQLHVPSSSWLILSCRAPNSEYDNCCRHSLSSADMAWPLGAGEMGVLAIGVWRSCSTIRPKMDVLVKRARESLMPTRHSTIRTKTVHERASSDPVLQVIRTDEAFPSPWYPLANVPQIWGSFLMVAHVLTHRGSP